MRRRVSSLAVVAVWLFRSLCQAQLDQFQTFNMAGFCNLTLEVGTVSGRIISGLSPAGDVDGDGREDLLIRYSSTRGESDLVVLLYGQPGTNGHLAVLDDDVQKTVIEAPALKLDKWGAGLAAGEDLDGDDIPDVAVAIGHDDSIGAQAILLIHGSDSLASRITVDSIGDDVRGSIITERNPIEDRGILGDVMALSPDINGDQRGEVLLVQTASVFERRRAFLLFGFDALPREFDLADIGVTVPGVTVNLSRGGRGIDSLVPLGDVDGDGLAEVGFSVINIIYDPRSGQFDDSFLLFGRRDFPELLTIDRLPPGFGVHFPRHSKMARAGDVDGDGREDLAIYSLDNQNFPWPGLGQLVFGRRRESMPEVVTPEAVTDEDLGTTVVVNRQLFGGGGGFNTYTPTLNLSPGHDLNGDGRTDFVFSFINRHVLYPEITLPRAGSVFVLLGDDELPREVISDIFCQTDGPDEEIGCRYSDDRLSGGFGVQIDGEKTNALLGAYIAPMGDFDGDGRSELLVANSLNLNAATSPTVSKQVRLIPAPALFGDVAPRVGAVSPESGNLGGGDSVMVYGTGFERNMVVTFDGVPAEIVQVVGAGIAVVKTPPGAVLGAVPVEIRSGQQTGVDCGVMFTYQEEEGDTITVGADEGRVLTVRRTATDVFENRGATTGDFNGDDKTDIVLITREDRDGGDTAIHFFFGTGERVGGEQVLDNLGSPRVATIDLPAFDFAALSPGSLGSSGDLNGDGSDDVVVKLRDHRASDSAWYVILGRDDFLENATIDTLSRLLRLTTTTEAATSLGGAAIVPDVSGDEYADLLVSYGGSEHSSLFVLQGRKEFPEELVLDEQVQAGIAAHFTTSLILEGVTGGAGDQNGDNQADLFFSGRGIIGEGAVAILYGGTSMFTSEAIELDTWLGGVHGVLVTTNYFFGGRDLGVHLGTDTNGDGIPEIFLKRDDTETCVPAPCSGQAFVFDHTTVSSAGFDAAAHPQIAEIYSNRGLEPDFTPISGSGIQDGVVHVQSALRGEGMGATASTGGDFNSDGFGDILVGNRRVGTFESTSNTCYILFGAEDFYANSRLDLQRAGNRALRIRGGGLLEFGAFVDGGFDWDSDGADDVMVASGDGRVDIVFGVPRVELEFVRGDSNGDLELNIADPIFTLGYLFVGDRQSLCLDAMDADDDGKVQINDPIYVLQFLFGGGPAPLPPHPEPGLDTTPDEIRCTNN